MYLTQSLHRAAQLFPDRAMTVCNDRVRTTLEVRDRVSRLAAGIRGLGVGEGDRVAILALNSDRYHELLYAIWWIGAVAQPVNTRWSSTEIAYALDDAGSCLLVVDDAFAASGRALVERAAGVRAVVFSGDGTTPVGMHAHEDLIADNEPTPDPCLGGERLALLMYTGGTTGRPKGVMISHRGLLTAQMGSMLSSRACSQGGVTLVTAPLFHIAAFCGWNNQNVMGGTTVFLPTFSSERFLDVVERHRVTNCILVPTMVQMLCDDPSLPDHDLSSLETITYGGAASSDTLLHRAMAAFPAAGFTQGYGMTETAVLTFLGREEHVAGGHLLRSVGRPTPTTELAVVDADGVRVENGAVGEIVTRGDHVMMGYWNDPEATAAALRDGWMHTGDAGYIDDDGYLYIVDRLKDIIISGGENVYSSEVENAIASHPAVSGCAVVGVADDAWGERVHAVVVTRAGSDVTVEEIIAHVRGQIARYKAPRTVEFVDVLPTSAMGKVLKRELRSTVGAPASLQTGERS